MISFQITDVRAREILDSRGNPTVEAKVELSSGAIGIAAVPSGASCGTHEALEKRDGDSSRYNGKGVLEAVATINGKLANLLIGRSSADFLPDRLMLSLDQTENKSKLGANSVLAVSLAAAKATAAELKLPLYKYLGGEAARRMPIPMMNILNGGAHASNNIDIQEFMIMPLGFESFAEALRAGTEIYHSLGSLLRNAGKSTAVGDEGGFAPDLTSDEQALQLIIEAIVRAGYTTDTVKLALDVAASEWYSDGRYELPKRRISMSSSELINYYSELTAKYPILSIEDGLDQDDTEGWKLLTDRLGGVALVGDDLFVTNQERLLRGVREKYANAVLVKPNQVGSLLESANVIAEAQSAGYRAIISHRSGETADTSIADIAVAFNTGYIKTGAPCRSERVAKYNRLMEIERELGKNAVYGCEHLK